MKKIGFAFLGLLLGAAVVSASSHVPPTSLNQNPVPTCIPHQPCTK
jgi:hypothetical protein